MQTPKLSPASRLAVHQQMEDGSELDVLVVGGGVTGAGIAVDGATRGLRVGIVEAQDWAAGTSSRSSRLVHGGLRYLYQLDFKLVAESLRERGLLLAQNAPHLVKAQPLMWPLKLPVVERIYSAVGVGLYDFMAQLSRRGVVPTQKHLTKRGSLALSPALKPGALRGSIVYYDATVDDARLVVTLIRTAVRYGALAANRTQLVEVQKDSGGRVSGAVLVDQETGREFSVRTRRIINATGVWTEKTQAYGGTDAGLKVLASKGIHLVIPRDRIQSEVGLFIRTKKSVLFMIPWPGYWLIGTTDTPYRRDLRDPVADARDVDYLLAQANRVLRDPLTREDIIGTYAGLRPLLQPGTSGEVGSAKISREHSVAEVSPGMTVIAGGKLTTYRQMAEDAVDFALGKRLAARMPSVTARTPLEGANGYAALWSRRRELAAESGLSVKQVEHLLNRYGDNIYLLFALIEADPALAEPLADAPAYLRAEVVFAVNARFTSKIFCGAGFGWRRNYPTAVSGCSTKWPTLPHRFWGGMKPNRRPRSSCTARAARRPRKLPKSHRKAAPKVCGTQSLQSAPCSDLPVPRPAKERTPSCLKKSLFSPLIREPLRLAP